MAAESQQKKLSRIRKPRVHITYDVEVGDATEAREIPFVVGVLSDLSGDRDPSNPPPKLKDRKFIQIDRDEFDLVMSKIRPRLVMQVPNVLSADRGTIGATLEFSSLGDFSPENVARKVPALNELLELRSKLQNLRSSLCGNDRLEELLQEAIRVTSAEGPNASARTEEKS